MNANADFGETQFFLDGSVAHRGGPLAPWRRLRGDEASAAAEFVAEQNRAWIALTPAAEEAGP